MTSSRLSVFLHGPTSKPHKLFTCIERSGHHPAGKRLKNESLNQLQFMHWRIRTCVLLDSQLVSPFDRASFSKTTCTTVDQDNRNGLKQENRKPLIAHPSINMHRRWLALLAAHGHNTPQFSQDCHHMQAQRYPFGSKLPERLNIWSGLSWARRRPDVGWAQLTLPHLWASQSYGEKPAFLGPWMAVMATVQPS